MATMQVYSLPQTGYLRQVNPSPKQRRKYRIYVCPECEHLTEGAASMNDHRKLKHRDQRSHVVEVESAFFLMDEEEYEFALRQGGLNARKYQP